MTNCEICGGIFIGLAIFVAWGLSRLSDWLFVRQSENEYKASMRHDD